MSGRVRCRWPGLVRAVMLAAALVVLLLASGSTPAASQAACDPISDPNVRGAGCPLEFSIPVRATLAHGTDLHYWHILIPVAGRVTFELLPRRDVDLDLYIVTPQDAVIVAAEREGQSRELSTFVCEAPGEYQVYVQINGSRDRSVDQTDYRLIAHASPEVASALPAPTLGEGRPAAVHLRQVVAMSFSPDGSLLAVASDDGGARVWQVTTGALLASVPESAGPVGTLAFSPDGTILATGGREGTVRLWRVDGSVLTPDFRREGVRDARLPPPRVVFSPDGHLLAVAKMADGGPKELRSVELWQAPSWDSVGRVDVDDPIVGHAFDAGGRTLALTTRFTKGMGWSLRAYDPMTQALIGSLRGIDASAADTVSVMIPVVDPSGQLVAVANRFETPALEDVVRLWRVGASAFEREIRLPTTKEADAPMVAFSADGQSLVVLSEEPSVARAFRVSDGAEIASRRLRDRADLGALTADGRMAAVSSGGTVRVATLP